jgi:hypothetical protein
MQRAGLPLTTHIPQRMVRRGPSALIEYAARLSTAPEHFVSAQSTARLSPAMKSEQVVKSLRAHRPI